MLERSIFSMAYMKYNRIWHRLLLVAGMRKDTRIYGLRVGAAGRLDSEQFPPPFVNMLPPPSSLLTCSLTSSRRARARTTQLYSILYNFYV
jgi:hypothetical protein